MKVDRAKAVHKDFGGESFYFCSEHCLQAFEADPSRSDDDGGGGGSAATPTITPDGRRQIARGAHEQLRRT
jgi:YHS domain-containing protein